MNDQTRIRALTEFASALKDCPLDPSKPEEARFYVPDLHIHVDAQGHEKDPVARLARKIDRAEGSQIWLFTGNIGSGKSTELRRLRGLLKDQRHVALLADASDYINLHQPVEISDFLISVSAAFAVEAGKLLRQDQIAAGYWERLRNLLLNTQITVDQATAKAELPGLDTGIDLQAAIKLDPVFKQRLQQHLQAHLSTLRAEVEKLLEEISQKLRDQYGDDCKIVLLFDSLERLRGSGEAADKVFTSLRQMCTQFHDMLRLPGIQVVYSIPLYLVRLEPQLYSLFGDAAFCSLTSAHIFLNRSRDLDPAGQRVIFAIISARYRDWRDYLPETQMKRLIEASGGDLRDLFRFLSGVLLELEDSEDAEAAVDYVLAQVARTLTWITEDNLKRLQSVSNTKALPRGSQEDMDALVRDLETKRVLMYLNGDEWHDIHPLLRKYIDSAPTRGGPLTL